MPSPASHSPGPTGIETPVPEALDPPTTAGKSPPLFRSRQSAMTSSITNFVSSSTVTRTDRRSLIHCRNCLGHFHGSDQSNNSTTSVFGTDLAVIRGFRSGAKEGDGSERRYMETRARISNFHVNLESASQQGLAYPLDPHLERLDRCSRARIGWQLEEFLSAAGLWYSWHSRTPSKVSPESLAGSLVCPLTIT